MRIATGLLAVLATASIVRADDKKSDATTFLDHAKLLAPIQVESLTLTPIVSTQPDSKVEVITRNESCFVRFA